MGFITRTINAGGLRTHFIDEGNGEPIVRFTAAAPARMRTATGPKLSRSLLRIIGCLLSTCSGLARRTSRTAPSNTRNPLAAIST